MGNKGVLSSAFNMSLGFIPVIVSILLCEFITQDISIYIGTGIGLIYSYRSLSRKGAQFYPLYLYGNLDITDSGKLYSRRFRSGRSIAAYTWSQHTDSDGYSIPAQEEVHQPLPASKCPMQPAVVCSRSRICHCIRTGRTDFRYSPFCCHQPDGFGSTSPHPDFHTCTLSRIAAYYIYSQHPAQSNRYPLL